MASLPAQPDKACVTMEKVWETQPHLVTEKSGGGRRPVPWEQLWSTSNSVYGNGLNPETSDATSGNHQVRYTKLGMVSERHRFSKSAKNDYPTKQNVYWF